MRHTLTIVSAAALLALWTCPADARGGGGHSSFGGSHSVQGYVTKNGTYVAPHMQTNPNGTKLDNWSTKGNVNPYTGKAGTKDPYAPTTAPSGRLVDPNTGNPIP